MDHYKLEDEVVNSNAVSEIALVFYYIRFLWLKPLSSHSSSEVARHLSDIFTIFGPPSTLPTDNGTEFRGCVVDICKEMNIELRHGRHRHPQTTGKVSISI